MTARDGPEERVVAVRRVDSLLFRALAAIVAGVGLVAVLVLTLSWFYLDAEAAARARETGNSLLTTLIRNTYESINKGQRYSFQRTLDDFAELEGVMEVALFARFRQMVYRSGLVSVGLPFVHRDGILIDNINESLYRESRGRFERGDWSLRDVIDTPASRAHVLDPRFRGQACGDCHYEMDAALAFDLLSRRAIRAGEGYEDFYYALPVGPECVICHTHWRTGEDGGYLRVRLNLAPFIAQRNHTLLGMSAAVIGLLLPTILILVLVFRRSVFRPLTRLRMNLNDLTEGEGNLVYRLPLARRDEMGQLASLFNRFTDKVQTIVIAIKARMTPLAASASQVLERSDTLLDSSTGIVGALERITDSTARLRDATRRVESSSGEVRASLLEVTASVTQGETVARDNRRLSTQAADRVQGFDHRLTAVANNSRGVIELLHQIKYIANRTNLIALNASIEAARAGEAGRGFVVVASEVRTLAVKTAELTQSIDRSLSGFSGDIGQALVVMREITAMMGQIAQVSNQGEEELASAAERLRALSTAFQHMETATSEQHAVADALIQGIDHTAAEAAEMRAISASLDRLAQQMEQAVSGVAAETSKFRTAVD